MTSLPSNLLARVRQGRAAAVLRNATRAQPTQRSAHERHKAHLCAAILFWCLKFTLPAAEAEKVTLDRQRALIVFRRNNFKKLGGTTWTLAHRDWSEWRPTSRRLSP